MSRAAVAAALTLGLAAVAAPAPAAAATAAVERRCETIPKSVEICTEVLTYTAAAGEANALEIGAGVSATQAVLTDSGAPIEAGRGCSVRAPSQVACDFDVATVLLGDGDDRGSVTAERGLTLDGGDGADVLTGGPRNDALRGGPGADRLSGLAGDDSLDGGAGADLLAGGLGADRLDDGDAGAAVKSPDELDGGPGRDSVTFAARTAPLAIDLGAAAGGTPNGEPGEGNAITGVEELTGGYGGDRIAGSGGRDRLDGGAGDDVVSGRGGADELTGGAGRDRLSGGAGRDRIVLFELESPAADRAACGEGWDLVDEPERRDLLERDCERIEAATAPDAPNIPAQPARVDRGAIVFRVPCPGRVDGCAGALNVRPPGARDWLGRVTYRFPDNEVDRSISLPVPVGPTRRLRGRVLEVRFQDEAQDLCSPCGWRVRLP